MMQAFFIQHSLQLIKKYNPTFDNTTMEEIEYGLVGVYLTITKILIILLLAWILNIITQVVIFMIIFNIIRTCSFGLHATKSWICLLTSSIIFILVPFLCTFITLPSGAKWIMNIIISFFIYKNSPADTEKRPIINQKRRMIYKLLSTTIAIIFGICALCTRSNFYSNCFIFAPTIQCFLISPLVYRFFHLPYDNYKTYLANLNIS